MAILITDRGVSLDDWQNGFLPLAALSPCSGSDLGALGIDVSAGPVPRAQWRRLIGALTRVAIIRIQLADFADIGAFSRAEMLRDAGYRGRLRARGAMLARHAAMARAAGFSEIELTVHQAQLQPPEHWLGDGLLPSLPGRGAHAKPDQRWCRRAPGAVRR
ncbi:MAG: DUF934 domain-containing protein [Pararhodobacter sp.]